MEPQTIIARRIARELKSGMLVNLGIGIPTLVANYVPAGMNVFFQSENGLIGTGAPPEEGMAHPTLTDAGGHGLGGILTQTGIGTPVENGKQRIEVDHLLETALRADFALVQAFLADYLGNLSYALTARNFNPVIAMAADTVIASADNIVPVGVISPDHVVTPAPVVDYLVANS